MVRSLIVSSFEARRARAAQRRANAESLPIRTFELGAEPLLDERTETTVDQRLQEILRLSYRAFVISGQPWPTYTRANIPTAVIRRWET